LPCPNTAGHRYAMQIAGVHQRPYLTVVVCNSLATDSHRLRYRNHVTERRARHLLSIPTVAACSNPVVLRPRRAVRPSKRVSVPKAQTNTNSITNAPTHTTDRISRHTAPYPRRPVAACCRQGRRAAAMQSSATRASRASTASRDELTRRRLTHPMPVREAGTSGGRFVGIVWRPDDFSADFLYRFGELFGLAKVHRFRAVLLGEEDDAEGWVAPSISFRLAAILV